MAVVAGFAGRAVSRRGFRPLLIGGPLLLAGAVLGERFFLNPTPSLARWLVFAFATGVGIGCSIPVLSSAAVATLEPQRFAIGSAVNTTFRQVGSVIPVAILVAVEARPTTPVATLASYRRGWVLVAVAAVASAAFSAFQPSQRVKGNRSVAGGVQGVVGVSSR